MRKTLALGVLTLSSLAYAEESVPVDKKDLKVFLDLAKQEKCRSTTEPKITSSPIVLVRDTSGRVYVKSSDHTITLDWCNYNLTARDSLEIREWVAPQPAPSLWYPRLKLVAGFEGTSLWTEGLKESATVGLSGHLISYRGWYPYLTVASTGFGGGVGYYLTPTLGVDVGYLYTWSMKHSPFLGVSLGLW